jgi:hypothetical protein
MDGSGVGTVGTTRFGAPLADFRPASGVLRARAARCGVSLSAAEPEDLVAAVVAADAWCLVLRTGSLTYPSRHGAAAVRALARILLRAAGQPVPGVADGAAPTRRDDLLAAATDHIDWVAATLGPAAVDDVVGRAAGDLTAAGPMDELAGYGDLLVVCAELR